MNHLASSAYRKQLRALHASRVWGDEGHLWAKDVMEFAARQRAVNVLDYGSGRGTLAVAVHALGGPTVREYDPGVPGKDALPMCADLVVATDVMEHVEPEKLDAVLAHIRTLALKGAFLAIATGAASARLPDGRNAHLTIMTARQWTDRLKDAGFGILNVSPYDRGAKFWLV